MMCPSPPQPVAIGRYHRSTDLNEASDINC
jgi:hypothetical protein